MFQLIIYFLLLFCCWILCWGFCKYAKHGEVNLGGRGGGDVQDWSPVLASPPRDWTCFSIFTLSLSFVQNLTLSFLVPLGIDMLHHSRHLLPKLVKVWLLSPCLPAIGHDFAYFSLLTRTFLGWLFVYSTSGERNILSILHITLF